MIEFQLFGPFGVRDENGIDRRPKLSKSRAILALLAATPGHRHTRSWFQTMLWQDRQHEQALSSLRTALADIRRHLGPHADVLITDHSEVALDASRVHTNLDPAGSGGQRPAGEFLEGFDIANAENFEDWLRDKRSLFEVPGRTRPTIDALPAQAAAEAPLHVARLYLAASGNAADTVTRMRCDALVDCIWKSAEDLGLVDTLDGRGKGHSIDDFRSSAAGAGCSLLLVSEAAEAAVGAIARLRVVETASGRLVWSKSITGKQALDLDDPSTIAVVAEFIDVLSERLLRPFEWRIEALPANLLAVAGMNHIFRLGSQNFETADLMLKRAHEMEPRASYLAWRAYLRTFLLGELEFGSRETVVEEGTALARRALENEPHNSMVLALCAHVENMLHNDYSSALDLSARALELNRCNPLAWASLGVAAAFLGKAEDGLKLARTGARMSGGLPYSFQTESWASSAGLLAGNLPAARAHAEQSHKKAPTFAPPLRFLSALYSAEGQYDLARSVVAKLRAREPDFTLERLRDIGYPSDSVRKAGLLDSLPGGEL